MVDDTSENRKNLREAFLKLGYGDVALLETMKFVPGWTDFKITGGNKFFLKKKESNNFLIYF
jgi:hypothetical protein